MKVHLSEIMNRVGIQGPGLISLLKKTESVIPVVGTKVSKEEFIGATICALLGLMIVQGRTPPFELALHI
jgi:hypothetical protein